MNKRQKYTFLAAWQLLIVAILLFMSGCQNGDDFVGIVRIDVQISDFENLFFESSQCEFDDRTKSWAYNFGETDPSGNLLAQGFITSQNLPNTDTSIDVTISNWLSVVFGTEQNSHNIETMRHKISDSENFYYNSNTTLHTQIKIGDKAFHNGYLDRSGANVSNEYFKIELLDHEFDYTDECQGRRMLYMKFEVQGPLYYERNGLKMDSLILNESKLELIFDIE